MSGPASHRKAINGAIGAGTVFAFALSWFEHRSLLWAVVHAVYSWFYVAYYGLTKSGVMAPIPVSPAMTAAAIVIAAVVSLGAMVTILFRGSR